MTQIARCNYRRLIDVNRVFDVIVDDPRSESHTLQRLEREVIAQVRRVHPFGRALAKILVVHEDNRGSGECFLK